LKKKIFFTIPSLRAGGAERITYLLATNLAKQNYMVVVCVLNNEDQFFEFDDHLNIRLIELNYPKVSQAFWKIRSIIQEEKPDVVISMITHLNTMMGLLVKTIRHQPKLLLRETNVLANLYSTGMSLKRKIRYKLNKIAYRKADHIICQSIFMKSDVVNTLGIDTNKCVVINNPVLVPDEKTIDHDFDLIALGNLSTIKGYKRMLLAMTELSKSNLKLGIIGEGTERQELETFIINNKLSAHVELLGHQKNPHAYLRSAKVLLMTSIFESFPNAVLEAGILGVPAVVYNAKGGLKEIIENGKNGWVVESDNVKAFCSKVNEVVNNRLNNEVIIEMTKKKFAMNKIISEYKKVLS